MPPLRPATATVPAMLLLGAIGWLAGGLWLDQIVDALGRVSVQVAVAHPSDTMMQKLGVALAVGGSAPLALLVRMAISRVSRAPATLGQWAAATGFLVLGAQVGVGGALFNTARVSIPSALDASAQIGAVQLLVSDLALGNWAVAGVVGAAIIVLAVGITTAGLEASEAAPTPPPTG